MRDNFLCSHEEYEHCKKSLKLCRDDCKVYGECGECEYYHIPHSQEPCNSCRHLKLERTKHENI